MFYYLFMPLYSVTIQKSYLIKPAIYVRERQLKISFLCSSLFFSLRYNYTLHPQILLPNFA
jgi:hypothetical protein